MLKSPHRCVITSTAKWNAWKGISTTSTTYIHVILSVEKLRHKAEATMRISGGSLFADATEEDMYAAIDALTDKLDRQVKKHKEKLTDHHRSEGSIKNQI